jgi:hypothetical protein
MTRHILATYGPGAKSDLRQHRRKISNHYLESRYLDGVILRTRSAGGRGTGGLEIENCSIDCRGMLLIEKILNTGSESGGRQRLRPSPSHAGHGAAALLVTAIRRAHELFAAIGLRLMAVGNRLAEATCVQRRGRDRQRGRDKISHEREEQE